MLKTIGVTAAVLVGLAGFAAPQKANAGVRITVGIGAPTYAVPAPVYGYQPAYVDSYSVYQEPVYVAPSYGRYENSWRDHDDHDRWNRGREVRRYDDHNRDSHRRDFRR